MPSSDQIERRASHPLEVRAKGRRLEGHAALFNVEARIGDAFTEVIKQGAFTATLKDRDIVALVDHDPSRLLGRTRSGTLRLAEDSRGLAFDIDVPNTQLGSDILALVQRGDVGGMSFGFNAIDENWQGRRRELRQVTLHEISVIAAFPAYEGTTIDARAKEKGKTLSARLANIYLGSLK